MLSPQSNLCIRPYYNHKNGCPNYGRKKDCPPIRRFDRVCNMNAPVVAIFHVFPFGEHVKKMKNLHPRWSQRQAECCLYWQGSARKCLRRQIDLFKRFIAEEECFITEKPEAMGVNITATMRDIGIELEWPPVSVTYQIALAGSPLLREKLFEKKGENLKLF